MAVQRADVLRRRGAQPYLLLVGIIVGSVLTALVVPFVAGEPVPGTGQPVAVGPGGSVRGPGGTTSQPGTIGSGIPGGPNVPTSPLVPGSGSLAPTPGGVPSTSLRATDVGVTAKAVKIGFLLLDTASLSRVGIAVPGVDPETQRQAWQAQLDEINERGGFYGRKAVGVFEKFDVLSQDDMRRACLALRDQEVFAAVAAGGYQGAAILCFTEEGGTALVNQGGHGTPTEYIERSGGRLFTMYPHSDRLMANWVYELHRKKVLTGKTIGIVSQEHTNPGDTVVGGGLIPALERFGYEVAHHAQFPADQGAASSRVPIEVREMQTKQVDLVMLTTSSILSQQFVQYADRQAFRPRYTFTDWASMNSDTSNQAMPDSYDGTILITTYRTGEHRVGIGERPPEKDCRRIYEEGTGRTMGAKGSNEHGLLQGNCTALKALELGIFNAGTDLTRGNFSLGMQAIGTFPMTMWGGGSFAAGKFDAADLIGEAKWFADCKCIKPTSGFHQSRF